MRTKLLAFILGLSISTAFAQNTPNEKVRPLDLPNIQVLPLDDTQTGRSYELYIKLPDEYTEDNETRYPALYITDAMWHIEILSGSSEFLMENLILVGISWQKGERGEISRFRDYTLLDSIHPQYESGQAAGHLRFIQNEVFGYVEKNYRTIPENRSYFGYSLSGAFGTFILLSQPETFKNYILGSPTTMLDDSYIHEYKPLKNLEHSDIDANVFLSVGELEEDDITGQASALVSWLESKGYPDLRLTFETVKDADHGQAFPMTSVRSMYWLAEILND